MAFQEGGPKPLGGYIAPPGKEEFKIIIRRREEASTGSGEEGELVEFELGLTTNPEDSVPMVKSSEQIEEVVHT